MSQVLFRARQNCHRLRQTLQVDIDDDVDQLFAQYEAEAAADRAKIENKVKKQIQKPNLSMREIREAGLAEPIANDNR